MRALRAQALQFCTSTLRTPLFNKWVNAAFQQQWHYPCPPRRLLSWLRSGVWKAVENVNRPPVRPFVAALSQMWGSKKLLKLAQAKHRICHTHGNDIKLVCDGAPGFPEMRDSSPTLSTGGGCSGWLPFHQRSLEARILCAAQEQSPAVFCFHRGRDRRK